jgi:hypothetical protein
LHKALAEFDAASLVFAESLDVEELAQSVYGFDADAVEAHGAFEGLGIIFRARVDLGGAFHELAQRHATAVVTHGDGLRIVDLDFDRVAEAHDVLVDAVIDHFFEQNVDAVLGEGAIAEFPNVHAGAEADVLTPVEGLDAVFGVVVGGGGHGEFMNYDF